MGSPAGPQRFKFETEVAPNGNEEESCKESCQEEKEVTSLEASSREPSVPEQPSPKAEAF
jgi:hypothetical protein